MTVCAPLLDATNRVSLENAIVGEGWGDPYLGQLCEFSINVLTKTQQFDRLLNRFGRRCDEPNRCDQRNKKSSASARHIACGYQILWLCGVSRDDFRSGLDFLLNVGIGVIGGKTCMKSVKETIVTNYFGQPVAVQLCP